MSDASTWPSGVLTGRAGRLCRDRGSGMLLSSPIKSDYAMTTGVVTAHLPKELAEERRRETLAALEDVDCGRVAEHAEVQAWAADLARVKKFRASSKRSD